MADKKEKIARPGDSWVSKKIELRGVGFLSTFRVFFGMTMVISLISMVAMQLFGMEIAMRLAQGVFTIQGWIAKLQSSLPMVFDDPILSSLCYSIGYALLVSLWIAISVGIFSIFAFLLGGVTLKCRERDTSVKKSFL
ncbi:MAG: hypothetical protein Q8Q33_09015 [Chlamydiota bacterium]|nr:hypothetical protein [Chlamydiota bacterium]